jgi:sigma-54 dependent transcriptional regulator, acetoin dehydrogenase operon transcriptional activator AcoR
MGELADRRLLVAARADFLEGIDPHLHGVPELVAASWRRSRSSGVQPDEVSSEYFTDLDLGSRLVRCAQPVIEQLAEQIADIPMCVALTDHKARLLARRDSDAWFGRVADRVYFAQGFGYAEGAVGTNGVGTVLEFGESVHIVGAEHFVDALQPFACAGAPVRDPFSGRILGVLDISCLSDHSSPILRSLVRSAASRIERNLLMDRNQQQQALFDVYSRVDARGRQAVLAVGPRVVMANSTMQTLLDAGDQEALQEHVRFVMHGMPTVDEHVNLPSGAQVRLRGSTVTVGYDVAGMVAVVVLLSEVGGDVRAPASPHAAPGRSPGGGCPAWRLAASTVETALRMGDPVLVLGERGTGRATLLAELFGRIHDGHTVSIAADAVEKAPRDVADRLVRASSGRPVLHVLRDIDTLSRTAVDTVAAALGDAPPHLAATATDAGRPDALVALFRASATLPPLRHRSLDLPAVVAAVLADLAPHREVRLSREALRLVAQYRWPGNLRQLAEALTCALRRRPVGCIEAEDLPAYCHSAPRRTLRPVDEIERDAIVAALREAGGNRVAAAAALGLARSTLYRKIRQYGITA